jgi:hypothetical protein
MEGGVTVFLTLLILAGAGIGGFLLFGAGGYLRKQQMDPDSGSGEGRPEHLHVEDDAEATTNMPPPPPTRAAPPE